jgi:hypothetical protein
LGEQFYCIGSEKFLKPKDAKEKERRFQKEPALGKFLS